MVHSTKHRSLSEFWKHQDSNDASFVGSIRIKKILKEWSRFMKAVKLLIQPSLQLNSKKKNKKPILFAFFRVASFLILYDIPRYAILNYNYSGWAYFLFSFSIFFFFLTQNYSLVPILLFGWRLIRWIRMRVCLWHYNTPMYASTESLKH